VGPGLAGLFERAFARGSERPGARPTATEWHAALGAFRAQLAPCPRDAGHKVPPGSTGCPWCAFVEQGGPNFFLGVGADAAGYQVDAALLGRLWDQIQAQKPVVFPRPALVVTAPVTAVAPPTLLTRLGRRLARVPWPQVAGGLLHSAALVLWLSVALFTSWGLCGSVIVFVAAFYLAGLATNRLSGPLGRLQRWLKGRFSDPEQAGPRDRAGFLRRMEDLNDEWERAVSRYRVEFRRLKDGLRPVQKEAAGLQDAFLAERYELEKAAARQARPQGGPADPAQEAQAREQYLRTTFLSDHKIPGFGSGRLALLASYGVETAFDISEESLAPIRGIGQKLRQTLLSWKGQRLAEFRYDPSAVVPGTQLQLIPAEPMRALVQRYRAREEAVRSRLQRGAQDLAALGRHHEQELQALAQRRNELATRAAQVGIDPGWLSR
jgi:DNA-binding helix-hairpin-helix protein with protein kinase domain